MPQLVPVNISATAAVQLARARGTDEAHVGDPPRPPTAAQLCNWMQENRSLDVRTAVDLGFPVGAADLSTDRQVLLFGVSKWADVESAEHVYRYGVSIRVVVQVSDLKTKDSLTLPLVCANVEANGARASAELIVRGFTGSLGQELPKWQSFGVEQYTQYMAAVSDIQATVMGAAQDLIVPQLLATTAVARPEPGSDRVTGTVHAVAAIAHGQSLDEARQGQPSEVADEIRGVYAEAGITGGDARPGDEQRTRAHEQLMTWGVEGARLHGWHVPW